MNLPERKPPQRVIDPIEEYDRLRPTLESHEEHWEHRYDRLYRELPCREWFGKTFSAKFSRRKAA